MTFCHALVIRSLPVRRFLPSLSALYAFDAAARHLNFTRAAEDLGITQSGISRQI
jgi:predicted transcriptional regulator